MGYKSRLLVSAGIPDESGTSKRVVVLRASLIFLCASLLVSPVAAQSQSLADLEIKDCECVDLAGFHSSCK